jgi:hypothetical protein
MQLFATNGQNHNHCDLGWQCYAKSLTAVLAGIG